MPRFSFSADCACSVACATIAVCLPHACLLLALLWLGAEDNDVAGCLAVYLNRVAAGFAQAHGMLNEIAQGFVMSFVMRACAGALKTNSAAGASPSPNGSDLSHRSDGRGRVRRPPRQDLMRSHNWPRSCPARHPWIDVCREWKQYYCPPVTRYTGPSPTAALNDSSVFICAPVLRGRRFRARSVGRRSGRARRIVASGIGVDVGIGVGVGGVNVATTPGKRSGDCWLMR